MALSNYAVTISITVGVNIASTSFSWDVLPPIVFDDIGDHCATRTRIRSFQTPHLCLFPEAFDIGEWDRNVGRSISRARSRVGLAISDAFPEVCHV